MTKADVLSILNTIRVAEAYKIDGKHTEWLPYDLEVPIEPVYRDFQAWSGDLTGVRREDDIPELLQEYITYLRAQLGVPITFLSLGPDREQTLEMAMG
jgi:adenylosuccinate synthase